MWDKKFSTENLNTPSPLLSINFFAPKVFSNTAQKLSTTKFFGTVRQKVFDGICRYPLPPLIHKLFRYQKFSETQHRRVHLQNFSALWDNKFSTENLDTPPPPLSINFIATGKFLKHSTEGFLYEMFRYCKTKNFRRKIVTYPSEAWNFSIPEIFWNTKGFPYEVFRYCGTKQFWRKIVIPAPSLIPNIFRYQRFSETQKGSSTNFFGTVRQKFFNGKSWYTFAYSTEITSGQIDVCKNSLKTNIETVVLFFNRLQELIKIFVVGRKICRC